LCVLVVVVAPGVFESRHELAADDPAVTAAGTGQAVFSFRVDTPVRARDIALAAGAFEVVPDAVMPGVVTSVAPYGRRAELAATVTEFDKVGLGGMH
jgi:hypothetical protein